MTGKKLTLMIYLCGSDLESKAGAAAKDLDEIASSGVNTDLVNVVVLAGGTTQWQNSFSSEETAVYVLSSGLQWEKKETFASPEVENAPANMGEADTLKSFLEYGHEQFPADKYALIMWNHGGGPMRGLCWDTAWAKDGLTMEEFTGALKDSPFASEKLSWIGFDACLMSSVETAHLVAPYAEYMIASEETEPSIGWSYEYLAGIEKDQNGGETGVRIVDSFMAAGKAASEAADKESSLTLACMDLSKIENVEERMDSFFSELDESLSPESFSELSNLREDTREFGKAINDSQRYDLVDLGDLVAHYEDQAPEQAAALTEALDQMVVYSQSNLDNCHGLSSYHPYYNKTYYEKVWRDEYDSFGFAPNYTEYINKFAEIWLGDAMGDWTQMSKVQSEGVTGETQYFSVQLTPEQAQYYAASELLVLTRIGSDEDSVSKASYSQVFRTRDVKLDENGVLTAGYNGRTLYAVDDNGKIIAGPLGYSVSDDGNLQIQGNYINYESGGEHQLMHAMFECADAPAGTDLPVLEQYVYDEDQEAWSNRLELREEDYQYLLLLHDYKEPTYDGETIRPFAEWEDGSWAGGYEVPLPRKLHFRFYDRLLDGSRLFACFEVSDTQANLYGTELMEVNNPNLTEIRFEEGAPAGSGGTEPEPNGSGDSRAASQAGDGEVCTFANEDLRISISGTLDSSEETGSLNLHVVYENLSDQKINASLPDGVRMADASRTCICMQTEGGFGLYGLEPGTTEVREIEFTGRSLAGLSSLQQISFTLNYEKEKPEDETEETDGTEAAEDTDGTENTEDVADTDGTEETGDAETADGTEDPAEDSGKPAQSLAVVLHPVDLDIRAVPGNKEYFDHPKELAACSRDSLKWTLHSVDVELDGDLSFAAIVKNEGTEPAVVPFPRDIIVNGVLLDAYDNSTEEEVTIHPGEECCFVTEAFNRQSEIHFFDHLSGSRHLTLSNILGTEGVEEIRTISFCQQNPYMYNFELPEGDWEKPPVSFTLSEPFSLDDSQSTRSMGGLSGDSPEPSSDEEEEGTLSAEEMTRALDFGGNKPVRTELYSRDGITVYGEHILIADQTVLMSFLLENKSDENKIVRFYEETIDGKTAGSFTGNQICYASSQKRVIQSMSLYDELEDDSVKNVSMYIWQDTKPDTKPAETKAQSGEGEAPGSDQSGTEGEKTPARGLPIVQQAAFTFPEGTAFNVDGGRSFAFEDIDFSVNCMTDDKVEGDLFKKEVVCPEKPEQYRKEVSFTLPDSLSAEEKKSVSNVIVTAYRDCGEKADPEDIQDVQETLSQKGIQDPSPLYLEFLTYAGTQKSEEKPDTYTASLSGLVCVHQDHPEVSYVMLEGTDSDGQTTFVKKESDVFDLWWIKPEEWCDDTFLGDVEYDMTIKMQNASASLDEFVIHDWKYDDKDEQYAVPYSKAPLNWFKSLDYTRAALTFIHGEDGTLQRNIDGTITGFETANVEIPVDGGQKTLELLPYADCGSEVRLLYIVYFEDGTNRTYDGGTF
ncbi:MAG: clostripain-related cysteine peptidase [Eubacteriales bacterium]|nr:clostripain-related cysteine peptidase [Eubacteriales bacterium]